MCPEFLREGSGVADFFDPPFVVVGHRRRERAAVPGRAVRVPRPRAAPRRRRARAEALKYACNAFHATKVSFANEMAPDLPVLRRRLPRGDARSSARTPSLNISPTYLRPGFAFGGSCLPKDLRALQHMARMNDVDVPLLAGTTLHQRARRARRRSSA